MKKSVLTLTFTLLIATICFAQKPKTSTTPVSTDESGFYINGGKTKVTELNCYEFDELILKVKNLPEFKNFSKISIGVKYTHPILYKYKGFENKEVNESGEFYFFAEMDVEKLAFYKVNSTLSFLVANSDKINKDDYITNLNPNEYTKQFNCYVDGLNNSLLKYTAFKENVGKSKLSLFVRGFKPNGKVEVYKENCKCYVTEITYQEMIIPFETIELKLNNQVYDPLLKIEESNAKKSIQLNKLRDTPLKSNPDCFLNNNQPEKLTQLINSEYTKGFITPLTFEKCNCSDSVLNEAGFKAKKSALKKMKLKLEKKELYDNDVFEKYNEYVITDENGVKNGCVLDVYAEHRGACIVKMGEYLNGQKNGTWEVWKYFTDGNKVLLSRGSFKEGKLMKDEYYD